MRFTVTMFVWKVMLLISMWKFAVTQSSGPRCRTGWINFGNKCYTLGGRRVAERLTQVEAEAKCVSEGGQLVIIQSPELQEFLVNSLLLPARRNAWIGLNDRNTESIYQWGDGSEVNYTNWEPHEPSGVLNDLEDCVEMLFNSWTDDALPGQWNDIPCSDYRAYICESRMYVTQSSGPRCRTGWINFGNKCYTLGGRTTAERLTQVKAEAKCVSEGGQLVIIQSPELQEFLVNSLLLPARINAWIGLNDRNTESIYQWGDGSEVKYTNWEPYEPSGDVFEDCVEMVFNSLRDDGLPGQWNDIPCYVHRAYICESRMSNNGNERGNNIKYACENNVLNLRCEQGRVINVIRANYGRLARDMCNDDGKVQWSGEDCMAYSSLTIVKDRCGQKETCTVEASSRVFGDQCPGTTKYLEVQHNCLPPRK